VFQACQVTVESVRPLVLVCGSSQLFCGGEREPGQTESTANASPGVSCLFQKCTQWL